MQVVHVSSNMFVLGTVYFGSGGRRCAEAILPLVEHDCLKWSCDDTERDEGLWLGLMLGFSLQFTTHRQESIKSFPAQHSSIELSCYRRHGQLSRSCVLNLSCDHFNHSCSVRRQNSSNSAFASL